MKLKTVTAKSMSEALAEVRRQLGDDAVVLHTRSVKRGGVLGLGARTLIEITAGDGQEIARYRAGQRAKRRRSADADPPAPRPRRRPRRALRFPRPASAPHRRRPDPPHVPSRSGRAGPPRRRVVDHRRPARRGSPAPHRCRRRVAALRPGRRHRFHRRFPPRTHARSHEADAPRPAQPGGATPTQVRPLPPDSLNRLSDELREVKRLVGRAMQHGGPRAALRADEEAGSDALVDQYLALIKQEVSEELAGQVIRDVRGVLGEAAEDAAASDADGGEAAHRRALIDAIGKRIPVDEQADELAPTEDRRPRVIALVGPTGVGKTTTVAKLAATLKLKRNKSVALITFDTYRIAAVDQLKTYAGIIGVPLHVASTPEQVARAVELCRGCDAVLIDTAGRSPCDTRRLDETAAMLEAAPPARDAPRALGDVLAGGDDAGGGAI